MEIILSLIIRTLMKSIKSSLLQILHKASKDNCGVDWCQCGNSLALCYLAVGMELPDSLWMNRKSEFGVIFLRCSPR